MRLERTSTGIRTLDQIIGGGLLKGGVYIVQGAAGTGKTAWVCGANSGSAFSRLRFSC